MKILGSKFREARKQQRLSQSALGEGICTQATVSKIENKNHCDSLDIFYSLCSKLGVVVDDYLAESQEQELAKVLDQVEYLCNIFKHNEAYEILEKHGKVKIGDLTESLAIKYLYFKGRTHSNSMRDCEQGLIYLNQAWKISKKTTVYTMLIVNAIAVTYMIKGSGLKKAQPYFKECYKMLQEFPEEQHDGNSYIVFFNLAKYFSEIKEYQTSIELCNQGIKLCKKASSNSCLDLLLYEKAYNQYHLNGSTEGFKIAYYFTDFVNHKILRKVIIKNMQEYNIKF